MNRFFKIIIIVLFSSVLLIGNQIPKYQWKEINLPNNTIYGIAEISSKNNFWIYEKTANFIYHYKDSIIQKIELPKTKKIKNHYHCIKIDSMKFFSTIVDENYHTSFYIYELGAWKKFNIEVDVPVRNIVQVSRDELYVYGDWGAIFHLKNKQLFQLNSPIKNHIMAIGYYDKNNIWFGVRKEGIYHYDRKNFTNIPINNYNKSDISNIVVNSLDEISIYMRSGSEYYKQKNKFINRKNTIDNTDNLLFDFSDYKNGVAYTNNSRGEYYLFYDKKWTTKKLEKNYLIYDCEMSGDGSIMFTSKGKIIIGNVTKNIFFMEHAGQYRLDGGIADYSNGTAFLNYNDDNFIDIFVQNSGNQQYNRLYKNNNGKNFDDISSLSKISFYESSDYFTVGDYDVNGEIDLLLTNSDYQLQLLKREKDLFKKYNIDIKDSSVSSIRNLQLFDFDNDNDLDIFNSYHYSNGKNVGNILLLKNNFFGSFIDIDTSITDLTKGWNNHNLFADFNNDNKTDIFISNSWIKNKLILSNENNEYELIKLDKNNMAMAIGLDFENDGDLDIFYVTNVGSLYLLINDSKGQFTKYLNGEPIIKNIKSFICNGDFNNDGFIDLFLSSSINERNYLLLNDSAKTFIDISQKAGIKENNIIGAISGDIDNDGDWDIFGIRNGNNIFWLNELNDDNWLDIKINYSKTPAPGYGTKVWIYSAEHLNEKKYLKGFRQIGSDNPGINLYSDSRVHFGVKKDSLYDIKIKFLNGKIITKKNISATQLVTISEYEGFLALWYDTIGKIIFLLNQQELYFYLASFLFALLIIFGGVRIGTKYFDWGNKSVVFILVFNISIYWIFVNIFIDDRFFLKYFTPIIAILFGIAVPIISSFQFYFKRNKHIKEETMEKLLNNIQIFSHGEFAMSNINSLQLFYNNYSESMMQSKKYKEKYFEYRDTFVKIIIPNLEKVLELCEIALPNSEITDSLNEVLELIHKNIQKQLLEKKSVILLNSLLEKLKQVIHNLKKIVYKEVSSESTNIVKYIVNSLDNILVKNDIEVVRQKDKDVDYWVLIKNYELADIIDNCIRNAIKGLDSRVNNKKIGISIYKILPKIFIEIKDNGRGINKKLWEKIFESGVSSGGTGMGLFHAKKLLGKYKGRIFVAESYPNKSTIIRIELLEGEKNDTKIIDN